MKCLIHYIRFEKKNCHTYRHLFALLLFICGNQSLANGSCVVTQQGQSEINVRLGEQRITLKGWTHLSPEDSSEFINTIDSAYNSAEQLNCYSAKQQLQNMLFSKPRREQDALDAYNSIQSILEKHLYTYLGLEFSNEEFAMHYDALRFSAQKLNKINLLCGDMIPNVFIERVQKVFPGPAFSILQNNGALHPVPIESHDLKLDAYKIRDFLTNANDVDESEVTTQTVEELKYVLENDILITNSIIKDISSSALTENARSVIRQQLDGFRQLQQLTVQRNSFMANLIRKTGQNFVVLIGNAHIEDLAKQLKDMCSKPSEIGAYPFSAPNANLKAKAPNRSNR